MKERKNREPFLETTFSIFLADNPAAAAVQQPVTVTSITRSRALEKKVVFPRLL